MPLFGIFIIGLFIGSFYNVVALRTLTKESIAFPPSHCTSCNHRLYPQDLVPVFSYIFLKGRCRYCKEKISPMYLIGELLTAFSFAISLWHFGFTAEWGITLIFLSVLICSSVTDLKEKIVPNGFIIFGVISTIILRAIYSENFWSYIAGGVMAFLLMLLIYTFSGGKMGGADVKIYGLIGLNLGFYNAVLSLLISCLSCSIIMVPLIYFKKLSRKVEIPFVPFITIGVLGVYIANNLGFSII